MIHQHQRDAEKKSRTGQPVGKRFTKVWPSASVDTSSSFHLGILPTAAGRQTTHSGCPGSTVFVFLKCSALRKPNHLDVTTLDRRRRFSRLGETIWIATRTLYSDPSATLSELNEAMTTLEGAQRIALRVFRLRPPRRQ